MKLRETDLASVTGPIKHHQTEASIQLTSNLKESFFAIDKLLHNTCCSMGPYISHGKELPFKVTRTQATILRLCVLNVVSN